MPTVAIEAAPAEERPDFPSAKAVNAAGDKAIAKYKGTTHEAAALIFKERRLTGETFDQKQEEAYRFGGEEGLITEQVVDPAELRKIFLEDFGDEVSSKDLFPLVQAADPDGDGWVQLGAFLDVVDLRKQQREKLQAEALVAEAYQAMGGDADKTIGIKSALLCAVASDFVGKDATEAAMAGVVKHKMKAVEEILGAGGQLDEEEMEEIRDVSKLEFEELKAFANALYERGADPAGPPEDD